MVDVPVEPGREGEAPSAPRLIAVVPAYNEEPTVLDVLDRLSGLVSELVIVDDGSTDRTRELVRGWLPAHPHAALLTIDVNRGMSAACRRSCPLRRASRTSPTMFATASETAVGRLMRCSL